MQSSETLATLAKVFQSYNDEEKKAQIKKVSSTLYARVQGSLKLLQTNGIFELQVKNAEGKEATWTIDLKTTGTIYKGSAQAKPNVTIILSDDTFQQLADGKVCPCLPLWSPVGVTH